MVQWLRLHTPTAGAAGSIPGQGTKILHAVQEKKNYKKFKNLKKKKKSTSSSNLILWSNCVLSLLKILQWFLLKRSGSPGHWVWDRDAHAAGLWEVLWDQHLRRGEGRRTGQRRRWALMQPQQMPCLILWGVYKWDVPSELLWGGVRGPGLCTHSSIIDWLWDVPQKGMWSWAWQLSWSRAILEREWAVRAGLQHPRQPGKWVPGFWRGIWMAHHIIQLSKTKCRGSNLLSPAHKALHSWPGTRSPPAHHMLSSQPGSPSHPLPWPHSSVSNAWKWKWSCSVMSDS